ncbi:MAG: metal-dependent phosphohydrolase, partial [Bacteroidota bacterium]|nr:metal-dependent phosphohydrolase [Bacteroidota bacterium]
INEQEIAYAISCHYSKWGIEAKSKLDKYLLACDELTGFIVACTKVRPNGISDLKPKSVKKSLKKKSFAASVDRNEIIKGIDLIDYNLDDHISNIINVLKVNADFLELKS